MPISDQFFPGYAFGHRKVRMILLIAKTQFRHPVCTKPVAEVQHALGKSQGHPDQPIEIGRFAYTIFGHGEGARQQYGQDAIEYLLFLSFRELRISRSFGIMPSRGALFDQQGRRSEPCRASGRIPH